MLFIFHRALALTWITNNYTNIHAYIIKQTYIHTSSIRIEVHIQAIGFRFQTVRQQDMEANLEGACGRGVTFWLLNQSTSFLSRFTRRINMHTTPSPRKKLFFSLKKTTPNQKIRVFNWVLGWRYCRVPNRQYPENRWGMEGWN